MTRIVLVTIRLTQTHNKTTNRKIPASHYSTKRVPTIQSAQSKRKSFPHSSTYQYKMSFVASRRLQFSSSKSTRSSKTVLRCLAAWAILVLVLLSIDVSNATRNPLDHPHVNMNYNYDNHNLDRRNVQVVRGGSTILQPPLQQESSSSSLSGSILEQQQSLYYPQQQTQEEQPLVTNDDSNPMAFLPKIGLEQITKALLHTSEWNKKLLRGVRHWGRQKRLQIQSTSSSTAAQSLPNSNNYQQQQQQQQQQEHQYQNNNYGSLPVNVHPSRTWQPPIKKDSGRSLEEEELTLFHAKTLVAKSSWGPQLLPYLKHICQILEIETSKSMELVLAMVYLDRACSLETPRSNGISHCPFVSPRTVHRLGLAALVVAKSATTGMPAVQKLADSLGIPQEQLQQMVEWMVGALGDDGMYVGLEELKAWAKVWGSVSTKLK